MSEVATGRRGHQRPHATSTIEQHSIDYIPLSERHGKPSQQFPFWFASGCALTSSTVGFIGPSLGLDMTWSLIAVVLGMAFGTIFMALHANQGPRLGIPQMIQSRAQFGYRGAIFSYILAVAIYVAYIVFTALLTRSVFNDLFHLHVGTWFYLLFMAVLVIVPIVGYDWVHAFNRWIGYLSVLVFLVMTILLLMYISGRSPIPTSTRGFSWDLFLVQFAAAAGYQATYVVYTSDYTRYLPSDVSAPKLISYVYSGASLAPLWLGCLGVVVASFVASPDPIGSFQAIGNHELAGFGTFLLAFELVVFIIATTPCVYGAVIDALTAVDSVHKIVSSGRLRMAYSIGVGVVSAIIAMALSPNLVSDYDTLLTLMLYCIIPWTAVNLVDYYVIRRGHYSVAEILKADGAYGYWNWRGIIAYLIGVASMIPFYVLSFYQGPAARALGGADISFVVGIAVAGIVYYALARSQSGTSLEALIPAENRVQSQCRPDRRQGRSLCPSTTGLGTRPTRDPPRSSEPASSDWPRLRYWARKAGRSAFTSGHPSCARSARGSSCGAMRCARSGTSEP